MKKFVLTLIVLTLINHNLNAQETVLNSFNVSERRGIVYLNWEISAGFTCNGTTILRATDTIHFEAIGEIDGICGSTSEAVPYDYTDNDPVVNQVNYYQLRLGDAELSPIRKVEVIKLGGDGFLISPNPISSRGKVYFNNPRQQEHVLQLHDMKATITTEYRTSNNAFNIDVSDFVTGTYLFSIVRKSDDEIIANGKLIVR